jgi:hypothetical protein
MHRYKARLLSLSDSIEEEVTININGLIITGFSTVCPYEIVPGHEYPVELGLVFLDGEDVSDPLAEEKYGFKRIENSYGYVLFGKVSYSSLDIGNGIKIDDKYFKENLYLHNHFVRVSVDRISVDFLSMSP